jgi:hypothetical protein
MGKSDDITILNLGESSGTSYETPVMGAERQPRVGFDKTSKSKQSVGSSMTKKGEIRKQENADYGKGKVT